MRIGLVPVSLPEAEEGATCYNEFYSLAVRRRPMVVKSPELLKGHQMRPSELLKGIDLGGDWVVKDYAARSPKATGGNFSTGYIVTGPDKREYFLKAMDYSEAFRVPNTAEMLRWLADCYIFEKEICAQCQDRRMGRIVHAIHSGSYIADASKPEAKVEYLVFELAQGDVRKHLDAMKAFDLSFVLRTLHHAAVGLFQLHKAGIAHQDLKPSNVLIFGEDGSKIGDLGCASTATSKAPRDRFDIAGDTSYAPPEQSYKYIVADWIQRRVACDFYHLGSLTVFLFSRLSLNTLIFERLAPHHRPGAWGDTYQQVLPYLQHAFMLALEEFAKDVPGSIRGQIVELVRSLCNPDVEYRGNSSDKALGTTRFSLERFISKLNLLAEAAEHQLISLAN